MTRSTQLSIIAVLIIGISSPASALQQPGGRGGPPVQGAEEDIPLVGRFDRNGDKILDRDERIAARQYLTENPELRAPARGRRLTTVGTPGPKVTEADVKVYPATTPLYDGATL